MSPGDSRTEKRLNFDHMTRTILLEQDADTLEGTMAEEVAEQKRGNKLLQGILASLATGAILLAVDIARSSGIS